MSVSIKPMSAIATFVDTANPFDPKHRAATDAQHVRSRCKFRRGQRVYAGRIVDPGEGKVLSTHECSAYVCIEIKMDGGEVARVEASRVRVDVGKPRGRRVRTAQGES